MAEAQLSTKEEKAPSGASRFFAIISLMIGLYSFLQGGMRGRSAGWEEMAMYAAPAVVCALISLAIDRAFLKLALSGAVLGAIGFYLGS